MPKINQQKIADLLQISRSTVSRCFTNHPAINPETRSRVFELASQMGYVHMEMRTGDKKSAERETAIGVLICTHLDEYFGGQYQNPGQNLLAGLSEFALLEGIRLDLHYVDPRCRSVEEFSFMKTDRRRIRQWSGVILVYPFPESVISELATRFPVVSLVEQSSRMELNCVDVDHYKGISMAVDRLMQAGHERIGFLTKAYEFDAGWSFRRYSAFVEKLARGRMRIEPRNIVNIPNNVFHDVNEGYDFIADRIRKGVTAWVCAADHVGYELIPALRDRGLSVPKDVSITGFDGLRAPDGLPRLSTSVVPYREIGLIGGKRLMDLVAKRFSPIQHILIEAGFRDGETIAEV